MALVAAPGSLAARDRSRQALEQRLKRAGHSAAARDEALAALGRSGLVDDARLAHSRAELLARRGYGNSAIRADLRRRLIPPEAAAEAIATLEPELDRARRLLEGESVTPTLLRRLTTRGFSRGTLDDVVAAFAFEA